MRCLKEMMEIYFVSLLQGDVGLKQVNDRRWVMINQIVHGDCLQVMKEIPDKSIDLILCDLPYGTTACKWDTIIPFEPLWKQYERIIKDNGAIVLFGSEPFSSQLRMSNINRYKYDWIWLKSNKTGHLNAKHRPLKSHELISVFSKAEARAKGVCMIYNPQGLVEVNRKRKEIRYDNKTNHNYYRESRNNKEYIQRYANFPDSVLAFNRDKEISHPTQKPVALFEYLIKTYTNEGEVVLDNCIGSGTTAIASLNTGRYFIGIEKDEQYHKIACERVANWHDEQGLFKVTS